MLGAAEVTMIGELRELTAADQLAERFPAALSRAPWPLPAASPRPWPSTSGPASTSWTAWESTHHSG